MVQQGQSMRSCRSFTGWAPGENPMFKAPRIASQPLGTMRFITYKVMVYVAVASQPLGTMRFINHLYTYGPYSYALCSYGLYSYGTTRFINVNVHYTNYEGAVGVKDYSGFRLFFTTKRRPNVLLGFSPLRLSIQSKSRISIPPKTKRWFLAQHLCGYGL